MQRKPRNERLTFINGIGPKTEVLLASKGIRTVSALHFEYNRRGTSFDKFLQVSAWLQHTHGSVLHRRVLLIVMWGQLSPRCPFLCGLL